MSVSEGQMAKRYVLFFVIFLILFSGFTVWIAAQDREQSNSVIRVVVAMVQLNVAVTDSKGDYVTGLHPSDFVISEDGIPQSIATFEEGNEGLQAVSTSPQGKDAPKAEEPKLAGLSERNGMQGGPMDGMNSVVSGANVFILFDTSNYMYKERGFVYAQDAIADFVRTLDSPYRVAFYSYSRDFYRAASLTTDRSQVLRGVRSTVNGDDSALYNALLMTLKDAGFPAEKSWWSFRTGRTTPAWSPPRMWTNWPSPKASPSI
jgi:VWFA-related protein